MQEHASVMQRLSRFLRWFETQDIKTHSYFNRYLYLSLPFTKRTVRPIRDDYSQAAPHQPMTGGHGLSRGRVTAG